MMKKVCLFLILFSVFTLPIIASGGKEIRENEVVDREQQQLEWCFQYSNRLGFMIDYINNPRLYQTVSEWIGVPYKYSGTTKAGIDCSGLVCTVINSSYNKSINGSSTVLFKTVDPVKKSDLREGDLVFFKIKKNRISHVGVYLGQDRFVHSSLQKGVMISHLEDPYYEKYFYKGGRIKD